MPHIRVFAHLKYRQQSLFFQFSYIFLHLFQRKRRQPGKFCHCDQRITVFLCMQFDHIRRGAGLLALKFFDHTLLESFLYSRVWFQDHAAANGFHGRIKPHNEFISSSHGNLLLQPKLHVSALSRPDLLLIEKNRAAQDLAGPGKKMKSGMIGQYPHGRVQHIQLHIQKICIFHTVRRSQHASSLNLFFLYIGQIDGHPLSGIAFLFVLSVNLDAADLTFLADWIHFQCIFLADRAGYQRSGNDGSKSRHGKCTVYGQSRDRMDVFFDHLIA